MMSDTQGWSEAYLEELEGAAAGLPAGRREELRAQVADHLQVGLAAASDEEEARAVMDRLGDPWELVAEAAVDLPAVPARPGPSAGELVAILLMGIGGIVLPLLGPAVGVMVMRSTPRWTARQVNVTWAILGVGVVAVVFGLVLMANSTEATSLGLTMGLLALGTVFAVGPVAALYAATRPRVA
ncbi:MAG: hypothetical protein WCA29_00855 [Jiangellales bacterium]